MKKILISLGILATAFAFMASPTQADAKAKAKNTCKYAYGHLIAKGWAKKHNVSDTDLMNCKGRIPPGIWKKLYGTWQWNNNDHDNNHDNDTTAPNMTSIQVTNITANSAMLVIGSNEDTKAKVTYGVNTYYGAESQMTSTFATTANITLYGLSANTMYHYKVTLTDKAGNTSTTNDATFSTNNTNDTTAPVITAITATGISSSAATITFTTDETANTEIRYGTTNSYGTSVLDGAYVTSHTKTLTGLSANTTYHYEVIAKDPSNNAVTSADYTFMTLVGNDTTAPMIGNISVFNRTNAGAHISWTTDENARAKVYYSLSSPVNKATASVVSDASLTTSHDMALTGLSANSHYYYLIEATDASNNVATASEGLFWTLN